MYQLEKITSDDLFGLSFLYQNEATESICVDSVFALFTQSLRYSVLLERRGTTLTAQTPTMSLKPVLNSTSSSLFSKAYRTVPPLSLRSRIQSLHISAPNNAIPLPITATGPPPAAPVPVNSQQKIRRKLQAALTEHRQNLKNDRTPLSTPAKPADKLKKRFWKDVSVRTDSGMPVHEFYNIITPLLSIPKMYAKKLESSRRRNPWSLSRCAPRPQPEHQGSSGDSLLQTPSGNRNSPRMGPPHVRPRHSALASPPTNLHRLACARHAPRRIS